MTSLLGAFPHHFFQHFQREGTTEQGCMTGALPLCPLKGGATRAQVPLHNKYRKYTKQTLALRQASGESA